MHNPNNTLSKQSIAFEDVLKGLSSTLSCIDFLYVYDCNNKKK